MLRLGASADISDVQAVMQGIAGVVARLPGLDGFHAGANRDYEQKSAGFTWGFTLDASDAAALRVYASDAEHKLLGAALVTLCDGGADGIMVFDLEVAA